MNQSGNPSSQVGTLWQRIVKQTVRWLYLLTQFAVNGARSRNWKALLMGLPAVVVGGIMLGILSIGQQTSPKHWQQVYNAAAVSALKKDDFATADVYFRRMAVLDGSAPTSLYGLALAAAGEGDEARARSLMQRIAPEDVAGYPPAHFWLARDMFKKGSCTRCWVGCMCRWEIWTVRSGITRRLPGNGPS
jgi:hypothetical protein